MTQVFALTLTVCIALPTFAQAHMSDLNCDDSARMSQTLTQVIGAERQGTGLRDPDTMLEVWVKRSNGDWMIVQSYANGTSCIVAIGEHWEGEAPGPA